MRNISFSAGYGYFSDKSYTITNFGDSFHDALFVGFGGISPVGKKTSFILDGMLISNTKDNSKYDQQNTNRPWHNTTDPAITNTTLILMPGMRFYSSYDKAFQISDDEALPNKISEQVRTLESNKALLMTYGTTLVGREEKNHDHTWKNKQN